jgi:hypothetical protein
MSWRIYLTDDRGHEEGAWNYTSNVSGMTHAAIDASNHPAAGSGIHWLDHLNQSSGPDGAALIKAIVDQFAKDPERYRAMNPPNGWGDYDQWHALLREMIAKVPEWPTFWSVSR